MDTDRLPSARKSRIVDIVQLDTTIGQLNSTLLADFVSFQLFMSHQVPCLLPELRTRIAERTEEAPHNKRDSTLKKSLQTLAAYDHLVQSLNGLMDHKAHINSIVFILGATPRSPKCIWQVWLHSAAVSHARADDSRRVLRQLIPHSTVPAMGPTKLFALVCTAREVDSAEWLTRVNFALPVKRAKQMLALTVHEHGALVETRDQDDDVEMTDDTCQLWYQWCSHVKGFKSTAEWL